MLADFTSSCATSLTDSSPGELYQRIPVMASPARLTRGSCAPIGIWPSALLLSTPVQKGTPPSLTLHRALCLTAINPSVSLQIVSLF